MGRKVDYFWNPNDTRSYNAIFNFVVGSRGCGKTYGSLKYVINKWLKTRGTDNPWQFIYLRRFDNELEGITRGPRGGVGKLFHAVRKEFPGHELEAKNDLLICDGEVMGYAVALSKSSLLKSTPYPLVHTIIFEEFLITDSTHHYFKNEARMMLDFHITVDRNEDRVTWFFLANNTGINNPYFTYFNLDYPKKGRKLYGNDNQILVEMCNNKQYMDSVRQTRLGQLIDGTQYGNYAIENQQLNDDGNFIKKKSGTCNYQFALLYFDNKLGCWYDYRNGCYYISNDYIETSKMVYAATTVEQKPNIMLFKGNKSPYLKKLIDCYKNGLVFYENNKLKAWFRDIMRMVYC